MRISFSRDFYETLFDQVRKRERDLRKLHSCIRKYVTVDEAKIQRGRHRASASFK